jgi:hypothetical protein
MEIYQLHVQCFFNSIHPYYQVQRIWRSRWDNGTFVGAILDSYCRQVKLCTEIALKCVERERIRRPNIVEIIDKLDRMENKVL